MNSSIFVPKTINVGYQNRSGTYTGKLAYVIYYDEKGKLRKETSWNSWRDDKIPNDEFENVPMEGFVLNKKAGDYSTGWDHRHAYCRVSGLKKEESDLKKMESKLDKLLSDDKKTELEIDEIAALLK